MKCQDVEAILFGDSLSEESAEMRKSVERHIENCPECSRLAQELGGIRGLIRSTKDSSLPESLDAGTRRACLQVLLRKKTEVFPTPIGIALGLVIVISFLLTLPVFNGQSAEDGLSLQEIIIIIIFVQNFLMLFLSPVLFKKLKNLKNNSFQAGHQPAGGYHV